ncbi:hypothetical protein DMT42_05795 [Streptomyces actuosus]|uniref:Uncharacterized protein n=1 Tax=Streptomyces actuosus TaxID=1885 RepID=A0A2U9NX44_STRAS|nr:hypothetical protein DMT42_05795 [Streptomyces actuosus]
MPGAGAGRGWVARPGAGGVPLRPPVPPQRHDCPQLSRLGRRPGGATPAARSAGGLALWVGVG